MNAKTITAKPVAAPRIAERRAKVSKTIKTGDEVRVLTGAHKGKTAKVVGIDKKSHRARLEGLNLVERHLRKTYYNPAGGKKTVHLGIDLSNLQKVTKEPNK